jgi:hypothetical protein
MEEKNMLDLAGKMVEMLKPLSSEDRQRVTNATFALLGEAYAAKNVVSGSNEESESDLISLAPRAKKWAKDNAVSQNDIDQYLHLDGANSEVIDIPGASGKEHTINAYVLKGILALLTTGNANFTDQDARDLCKRNKYYSDKHHAEYMKEAQGLWVGSKENGLTLTSKGLKAGATIIKPPIVTE